MSKAQEIDFGLFGYIHEARQTHGLRAQDYQRYRRFCAHRLRNVRKVAKLTQGTSTSYRKKDVSADPAASHPEHIELLLLQAERAWAFAMELRELFSRTEEPRQRYHLIRRLRAACKAAAQLASIASGTCNARTSLEAQAYWLQMQSQLHFEVEEWSSALDCAVLSRVISEQLALTGSSRQHALAHSMIEALDPIVRLAAYRVRMPGAQQSQPAEIAAQWHEAHMLSDIARVALSIPSYSEIAAALDAFVAEAASGTAGGSQAPVYANNLLWRGGNVSFASQEVAALLDGAQKALLNASENEEKGKPDALDAALAAFVRVKKEARRCHADGTAVSAKVSSAASEALSSAYLAVQLYSMCALNAITIAKHVGMAADAASKLGLAIGATGSLLVGRSQPWISDHADLSARDRAIGAARAGDAKSGLKRGAANKLPVPVQVVIFYDMVRKSLGSLKASASEVLGQMAPATSRAVCGHQILEEVAAAEAYYGCIRNYFAAALHASPAHGKFLDALALLDSTLSEAVPRALALTAATAKHGVPQPNGLAVEEIWQRVIAITSSDVERVQGSIESAIPPTACPELLAGFELPVLVLLLAAEAQRQPVARDWLSDPASRPAIVASEPAESGKSGPQDGAPLRVPNLVDLSLAQFTAVAVKPLFYDLAGSAIDFDHGLINQKAGKVASGGSSKLGSIIGSLWGSSR
ncbi:signal recognition particle subunit srp68 [Coemansia sp. RSA 2322]|nr:signal recognition particle subunit srp68 [Coemansia sp. RSA 2322]